MNQNMNRIPVSGGIEDVYWNEALGIWEDKSGKPTVKVLSNLDRRGLYIYLAMARSCGVLEIF